MLLVLHNAEEALMFPRYLPIVRARAPDFAKPIIGALTCPTMLWALALATLIPLAIAARAVARPNSRIALWLAVTIQAVVAVNVLSHIGAAIFLGGYSPGVAIGIFALAHHLRGAMRRASAFRTTTRWPSARRS